MSEVQMKNGLPCAFGLTPGVSTIEDIRKHFGEIEQVDSMDGSENNVAVYSFSSGKIQAAQESNNHTFSTLWVSPGAGNAEDVPTSLAGMREIFPDLRLVAKPRNGLLLAEQPGVKVACDMLDESQKVVWLELRTVEKID